MLKVQAKRFYSKLVELKWYNRILLNHEGAGM